MKAMGIIFSNIYDSSLGDLTVNRTVASLPFGGRYRQIDFVLSNFSNSGIYNIGIVTKYNYRSLMDHLGNCADWDLNRKNAGAVILPPFAHGNIGIYKGKLEALYSAYHFIDNPDYDYVVICDSTILCNLDLRAAIKKHIQSGVDITMVANREKDCEGKYSPLVLKANNRNRVTELLIDAPMNTDCYVGMGIFIMSRVLLTQALNETHSKGYVHLERDYLQRKFHENNLRLAVYPVSGVVLRNQDIKSYYANNMALLNKNIRDGLFLEEKPIYTKVRDETPSYYGKGNTIHNCIIADGCRLYGKAEQSILFRGVNLEQDAEIRGCIVMQGTKIGKGAKLECVILDKNVMVREGAVLKGTPEHPLIIKKGEVV